MEAKKSSRLSKILCRILPRDQWFPVLLILVVDVLVYFVSKVFLSSLDRQVLFMDIDAKIPFVPGMIWIYVLFFPYWIISGFFLVRKGGIERYRLYAMYLMGFLIALIGFIFIRLEIVRPEVEATNLTMALVKAIYDVDSPTNLFPSLHCVFSYITFIATFRKREFPWNVKVLSFIMMCLIFASTITVKQHYFWDMISGILVGMFSSIVVTNSKLHLLVLKLSKKVYGLFKIQIDDEGNEVIS